MSDTVDPEDRAFWPLALTWVWMPLVPVCIFYLFDAVRPGGAIPTLINIGVVFAVPILCVRAAIILRQIKSRVTWPFVALNWVVAVASSILACWLILIGSIRWGH